MQQRLISGALCMRWARCVRSPGAWGLSVRDEVCYHQSTLHRLQLTFPHPLTAVKKLRGAPGFTYASVLWSTALRSRQPLHHRRGAHGVAQEPTRPCFLGGSHRCALRSALRSPSLASTVSSRAGQPRLAIAMKEVGYLHAFDRRGGVETLHTVHQPVGHPPANDHSAGRSATSLKWPLPRRLPRLAKPLASLLLTDP